MIALGLVASQIESPETKISAYFFKILDLPTSDILTNRKSMFEKSRKF
jgi:hypothetical protein